MRWYENALITVPDTRTSTMSPSTLRIVMFSTLLAMPDFRMRSRVEASFREASRFCFFAANRSRSVLSDEAA